MMDTEIFKALECCTSKTEIGCELCPYSSTVNCLIRSTQDALDLIRRQQEEIERWKEQNVRLNKECDHFIRFASTAKAEAIREFAERAYKKITEVYNKHIFGCNDLDAEEKEAIMNFSSDVVTALESIEKEMTEDNP